MILVVNADFLSWWRCLSGNENVGSSLALNPKQFVFAKVEERQKGPSSFFRHYETFF